MYVREVHVALVRQEMEADDEGPSQLVVSAMQNNFFCPFYAAIEGQETSRTSSRKDSERSCTCPDQFERVRAYLGHVKRNCLDPSILCNLQAYEELRELTARNQREVKSLNYLR